jgi:hypothetical protein
MSELSSWRQDWLLTATYLPGKNVITLERASEIVRALLHNGDEASLRAAEDLFHHFWKFFGSKNDEGFVRMFEAMCWGEPVETSP